MFISTIHRDNGSGVTIDSVHHEQHEGEHYYGTGYFDLGASASTDFCVIAPPDVYIHMVYVITGSQDLLLEIYEGSSFATDGTAVDFFNSNRNSNNTTSLLAYKDSTVSSDGSIIYSHKALANSTNRKEEVGTIGSREEIILRRGEKYIYRLTDLSASTNQINYLASFYETKEL